MKQLFLVLVIAATTLSVSAQRNYNDNDRRHRVERYNNKNDRFDQRQKEDFRRQIARINDEYDARIRSVKHMPLVRSRVKARKINDLENERRYALNECRAKFYRQMDYTDKGRNHRKDNW